MNNDAVLTKALNEIARLELINFRQAVAIEQLQNEISIRDQMKGGQNVNDTTNTSTEHEQKPSVSEEHND
ncbi:MULTISPECIES: hypothetical protein [Lactobacillus]|mgnify:FL=1|jgi:hypothetical protein|uniref:Transposase n=1 Tax=Lactobacillus taiwanensis TaxID=508451 RepID=A0A256L934_9LACO|nr:MULTISPECIES: hypothetical protein [Lactobacillus]OYR86833.1 hypothetical protein CBF53_10285 [Lactobacillus taiwanensis]OYR89929.1 hypothetical protein CBF70_11200 [Lactobacillus taiwanensis]OYR93297.1 hypothetical protein CBF59_01955 [Lactobacillus taiwanensis]OYR93834.1 hypothetical protein CBF58_11475 [Lactobacillus taiwanensis]UOC05428.1 hypothetical protein LC811_06235 [Lactobacillus johnsonii]